MRQVLNQRLAAWIAESSLNRLSYIVNNNPNGVMEFLRKSGVAIRDINSDGVITVDELYAALTIYAQTKYGSIQKLANHIGDYVLHNDYATSKWNIYKTPGT